MRYWLIILVLLFTACDDRFTPAFKVGETVTFKRDGRSAYIMNTRVRGDDREYQVMLDDYESPLWLVEGNLERKQEQSQ